MSKSLELSEEFELNGRYFKSIYYFYHCYQIACEVIGFEDKNINRKNRLFKRLLGNYVNGKFDTKIYNKIKSYMMEDVAIISQAFELIDTKAQQSGEDIGDLDKGFRVGILSLDFIQE